MDVGALVWVQDPADGMVWTTAQITRVHTSSTDVAVTLVPSGRQLDVALAMTPTGECRNVLLQNPAEDADPDDLVALPHLHEASILHALQRRYARDAIYTRIGEILVSVNPFKRLPSLYTRANVDAYAPQTHTEGSPSSSSPPPPPHLFAIARAAFVDLVRHGRDQSILISGESGAGKTEATKILMAYFADTCGASTSAIQSQVLYATPLLEAFGNARTVRNDNSSRFGKFIELQFDAGHAIVGARIRTYLLEKIRVVTQSPSERNFHVFYELVAAATTHPSTAVDGGGGGGDADALRRRRLIQAAAPAWKLGTSATEFRLLSQSGCLTRRDGVDDNAQFDRTLKALQQVGLGDDSIVHVLSVVAALLHLGNVAFSRHVDQEAAVIAAGNEAFGTAAALLSVDPARLAAALTQRTLTTATESLTVAMDVPQAEHTRNALVMECYRLLFAWLVATINREIDCARGVVHTIGLLDIFGFEDMAVNSFEQLCINYANEALQHQFNEVVFAHEQRLYADEGIAWQAIDFPNNKACLELFERRPMGIFSLADQECLFPQGSDRALLAKLYTAFDKKDGSSRHFAPPSAGWQRQSHFVVAHYAGRVSYAVDGFLAKNRDAFCETAAALLATSATPLVQSLSCGYTKPSSASTSTPPLSTGPGKGNKSASTLAAVSVGTQFKLQLADLLEKIRATAPHYVRCIKPNDRNGPDAFHAPRVLEQLRSGGVLEAVRVARAGFPVRMGHRQFADRYQRVLRFHTKTKTMTLATLLATLHTLVPTAHTDVNLGKTLVFFRRSAYEQLEQLRVRTSHTAASAIQRYTRGYVARHHFRSLRLAVQRLQARWRGYEARRSVDTLRCNISATILQTATRRWLAQHRYRRVHAAVVAIQTHARRRWATAVVRAMRKARAATAIASFYRCRAAHYRYSQTRRLALALQCHARRSQAKKTLRSLRAESRNVAKLQQDNLQLQAELAVLRLQLLNMQTTATNTTPPLTLLPPLQSSPVLVHRVDHDAFESNQRLELLDASMMKKLREEAAQNHSSTPESTSTSESTLPSISTVVHAPQSVCPPSAPGRRGSFSSLLSTSSSTTKAELFAHNRSRSTTSGWKQQQHAHLDLKVKQLREELKAAAAAAHPEEEQDEIVKRFVTAQVMRLHHRHSGNLSLDLPEDCDNNSVAEDQPNVDPDVDEDPGHKVVDAPPPPPRPPLTACAPHSRFAWASTAPLSARLPSTGSQPRFFGDDGLNAPSVTRSSALSSRAFSGSSLGSQLPPPGSVPRWCKDSSCKACACQFTFLTRRHHCRSCGNSFCFEHSTRRMLLPELGYLDLQRVCDDCFEWRCNALRESHASFGSGRMAEVHPIELAK